MKKSFSNRAVRRLKIIAGQLKGLERMLDEGKYCIDVLHQALAIKQALSGVEDLILENHLSTCVSHQMKSGKTSMATKEILNIYKLSKRK